MYYVIKKQGQYVFVFFFPMNLKVYQLPWFSTAAITKIPPTRTPRRYEAYFLSSGGLKSKISRVYFPQGLSPGLADGRPFAVSSHGQPSAQEHPWYHFLVQIYHLYGLI